MEDPASFKSLAMNQIMVKYKAYQAKESRSKTRNVLLMTQKLGRKYLQSPSCAQRLKKSN